MKTELITILESFGYPVFLQGSLNQNDPYPESFFTFWNSNTADGSHYNNKRISCNWDFSVNFYSSNPTLVNTMLLSAIESLRAAGWIISGDGYDVPSDEPTHTGRGVDAIYPKQEETP